MRNATRLAVFAALLGATVAPVSATLSFHDFLAPNDQLIVFDSVTNLEWLTPVYTRNHVFSDAFVQSVETTYGFHYATAVQTTNMINSNFGNPTTVSPGDAAGFTSATNFMNTFGIAQMVTCSGPGTFPCPRTQGLTSDVGTAGTHLGFGMIAFGTTGWFITNNAWPDTGADGQMGSFLIRTYVTPEPSTMGFLAIGFLGLLVMRWRAASRRR